MSILRKLKIFGFPDSHEQAIFASLLTGEPLLFIGGPGLAKTEVVALIGAALREDSKKLRPQDPSKWFSYQIYDASKLNFEDLLGYPNANAMKADPPRIEFIPTPSTIWDKQLIAFDELNRCVEDRQSNLFEIIRSRKLNGIPTNNQFIFSTMNPFGDQGTIQMSDALVDRHLFYLRVSDFVEMEATDRKSIISRIGAVDSVGLRYWGQTKEELDTSDDTVNELLASVGADIRTLMIRSSVCLKELKESIGDSVTEVIDKVVIAMDREFRKESPTVRKEVTISGRRASSVLRGVLALRAVQISSCVKEGSLPDVTSTIINGLKLAIPIGISGKLDQGIVTRADKVIEETVRQVWTLVKKAKNVADVDKIAEVMNSDNPIKILDTLLSSNMTEITRNKIFSLLLDDKKYMRGDSNSVNTMLRDVIKVMLYKLDKDNPGFLPTHIKLDVTNTLIEEVSKKTGHGIKGPIMNYEPVIAGLIQKAASTHPMLVFVMKASLLYYADTIKTDEEAIKAIAAMNSLSRSVAEKLKLGNKNDTQNTQSNPV